MSTFHTLFSSLSRRTASVERAERGSKAAM
jgi:hypothetical protein